MARQLRRWWAAPPRIFSPRIPSSATDLRQLASPNRTHRSSSHHATSAAVSDRLAAFTALSTSPPQEGIHLGESGGSLPSHSTNPVAFRRVNHTFLYLYPRDT